MGMIKRRKASTSQLKSLIKMLKTENYFQKLDYTQNKFIDTHIRCPLCGNTVFLEIQDDIRIVQCNTPLCIKEAT